MVRSPIDLGVVAVWGEIVTNLDQPTGQTQQTVNQWTLLYLGLDSGGHLAEKGRIGVISIKPPPVS